MAITQDYLCATDPRDRIFAFMGLSSDNYGMVPEYSLDCAETYKRLARSILKNSGLSRLLIWARSMFKKQASLPSSVPDWSVETSSFLSWSYPRTPFTTGGKGDAEASLNDAVTELKARGVVIDRVSKVTRTHIVRGEGLVDQVQKTNQWISDLEDMAQLILNSCPDEQSRRLFNDRMMDIILCTSFRPLFEGDDGGAALASECYRIVRKFGWREELPALMREGELTGDELPCLAGGLRFEPAQRWLGMRGFVTDGGYVGVAHPYVEAGDVVRVFYGEAHPFLLRRQGDGSCVFVSSAVIPGGRKVGVSEGDVEETFTIK